jgi:hypothetical protein
MRKILKGRRPSPAMIIAIVALVAALGGTAVAAKGPFLPKSKFSNFKKNTAVKGPITYVNQTQNVATGTDFPASGVNVTAPCPSGFVAIGGGFKTNEPSHDSSFFALNSYPSATGWTELLYAHGATPDGTESTTVTAICAKAKTSGTLPSITP